MIDDPVPSLKRQLAAEILASVSEHGFFIAARILGLDPPRLSDLRRGRVDRFSVDRLLRLLARVNRRVDVSIVNTGPRSISLFRHAREEIARKNHLRVRAADDSSSPRRG